MKSPACPLTIGETFGIPHFRRLWIAQLISVFGDFLAVFAVFAVAAFRLHATPSEISFLLVAYMLPVGVVSPLAGVMVDRWNPKRTMIVSDLLRAAVAGCLPVAGHLWQIYLIFIALGTISCFFTPAHSLLVRRIVPARGLMAANALTAQAIQVTQMLSPAAAGFLVSMGTPDLCFGFNAGSFLLSAAAVWSLPEKNEHVLEFRGVRSLRSEMWSGLRFIFTNRSVCFVVVAMTVAMFAVRCFGTLLAVWVRDVLAAGPGTFGSLNSCVGAGMICATQMVTRAGGQRPRPHLVVFGLGTAAGFLLLLATFPAVWTTALGLFGIGIGIAFIFVPTQTLLQQNTPPEMLGRVTSSLMSSLAIVQVAALLLAGSGAGTFGIRPLYFASAAILAGLACAGLRRFATSGGNPPASAERAPARKRVVTFPQPSRLMANDPPAA